MKRGIVSGYFNPLHQGHIEYISVAKLQCEHLTVIVNNDLQVQLKGSKLFMDQNHRCFIMKHIREVDDVHLSVDHDKTVCQTLAFLRQIYPEDELYFFNSGDRIEENIESAEVKLCKKYKIKYILIPLPKKYSSSKLLESLL